MSINIELNTMTTSIIEPDNQIQLNSWIYHNIKKRNCFKYVQDRAVPNESEKCFCGKSREDHKEFCDNNSEWTVENNTEANESTDAYGEIEFIDESTGSISKYVKLDVNTSMDVVMNLLMEKWQLYRPNLIISVTGGAKAFDTRFKLIQLFQKGLMKAARGTGAWIITAGTDAGVMCHVGEAVRDYGDSLSQPIVCLGIAPWGCIANKNVLINCNPNTNVPVQYKKNVCLDMTQDSNIESNHTHFIFVDDGTSSKYGTEISFRASVESEVSKYKNDPSTVDVASIPLCCVVVEGGQGTLKTVHSSLSFGTPVVIVKGSGRAANVLSNTLEKVTNMQSEHEKEEIIKEEIVKENLGQESNTQLINLVKKCWDLRDLITVVNILDDREALDVAILKALIKANHANQVDQIKLALCWNRLDIAKNDLLIQETKFQTKDLTSLFYNSLVKDRSDFADLFIDIGIDLKCFAQNELVNLYKETSSDIQFLNKSDTRHILKNVDDLIKRFMGPFYKPEITKNRYEEPRLMEALYQQVCNICSTSATRDYLDYPVYDLFIWSVLVRRNNLSLIFFQHIKEPIAAALMASFLLHRLAKKAIDNEIKKELLENATNFETIAKDIIYECYMTDEKKAQLVLIRKSACVGNVSCLTLAEKTKHLSCIGQTIVQGLLSNIWLGGISSKNNFFVMLLAYFGILFFPILPFIIKLMKFRKKSECENDVPFLKSFQDETFWKKLKLYFNAPIIKFTNHCLFYILFLGLFSYIMLCNFNRQISTCEIVLYVWIFSLAVEEVLEIKILEKEYLKNLWNICDVLCILLFITAAILRSKELDTSFESARIIFAFSLLLAYIRTLHMFSVMPQLGPKLLMIYRMTIDMLYFIAILIIFIVGYGIALNIILYPNAAPNWSLITSILHKPYFQMFGELFLEEMQNEKSWNGTLTYFSVGKWISPIMLGVYIMMTNLLMFNLLIATFSFTVNKINENIDDLWRFQRLKLIKEFYNKPILPPPLSWIFFLNRIRSTNLKRQSQFDVKFASTKNKQLMTWESRRAEDYLKKKI